MSSTLKSSAGFTYLGLLILVAIIGIATSATLKLGSIMQRRSAEERLLAIGSEFRNALESYANASAPGRPRSPASLQELLIDSRSASLRRHLRRIYIDPISGDDHWGVVSAIPGPGISGIYSLAKGNPIKRANFDPRFEEFSGQPSYQNWIFSLPSSPISLPNVIPKK